MTIKRNDQHSTEFGLWTRGGLQEKIKPEPKCFNDLIIQKTDVSAIDSDLGYHSTNIDYIWRQDYKYILIEEKRFMSLMKDGQHRSFSMLDRCCEKDKNYYGTWMIRFEHTNPEDGKIYISRLCRGKDRFTAEKEVDAQWLLRFLTLDWCNKQEKLRLQKEDAELKLKKIITNI